MESPSASSVTPSSPALVRADAGVPANRGIRHAAGPSPGPDRSGQNPVIATLAQVPPAEADAPPPTVKRVRFEDTGSGTDPVVPPEPAFVQEARAASVQGSSLERDIAVAQGTLEMLELAVRTAQSADDTAAAVHQLTPRHKMTLSEAKEKCERARERLERLLGQQHAERAADRAVAQRFDAVFAMFEPAQRRWQTTAMYGSVDPSAMSTQPTGHPAASTPSQSRNGERPGGQSTPANARMPGPGNGVARADTSPRGAERSLSRQAELMRLNAPTLTVIRQVVNNTGRKIEEGDAGSVEVFQTWTDIAKQLQIPSRHWAAVRNAVLSRARPDSEREAAVEKMRLLMSEGARRRFGFIPQEVHELLSQGVNVVSLDEEGGEQPQALVRL